MPDVTRSSAGIASLGLLVIVIAASAGHADETPSSEQFSKSIAPLLLKRCVGCHSGDDAKGGLSVTTRQTLLSGGESGPALVPGKSGESPIWQRVMSDEMPPKHPLTDGEKNALQSWIDKGAVWSGPALDPLQNSTGERAGFDWWSLQPLRRPEPASTSHPERPLQPLDAYVQQVLESHQLHPAAPATRRLLIRRLSFDLTGLPPAPEDVSEFEADAHPDAAHRLVDRLLASPHYGERWARHWLDVVRFGESNGFERDLPRPHAWHYRDWIIQAMNADLPYDEFVRWQLAGDILAPDSLEAIRAVGFLVAGAHDTVVPVVDRMRAMMRQDELEDTIGVVGQTFLGLTLHCARCHDHKFDPITAREYYQVAAALSGVDHGEREFTPAPVAAQLAAWQTRREELNRQIEKQDQSLRERLQAERAKSPEPAGPLLKFQPLAAWDFTRDGQDLVGRLAVKPVGSARFDRDGLIVDGQSYAATAPLEQDLVEKTLQVRVKLKSLQQAGGAAISLQTTDGNVFDAIVFGELEPQRWMPGSNGFQRTLSFRGPAEEKAEREAVTITQVHRADGTIVAYRDGQPYGNPVRKDAVQTYRAGQSQILFGLRHGTSIGGNRMLSGTIVSARLYDRALSADEVAAAANDAAGYLTEADVARLLDPAALQARKALIAERDHLRSSVEQLASTVPIRVYSAITTQPPPMKVHRRGSVTMLGEPVAPAGLAAVRGLDPSFGLKPDAREADRRLRLADWITSDQNALFARVMANRIWHYHFGAGFVDTPSDFGFNGGRPSHPELLEMLAMEFRGGAGHPARYSIKRLHRQIVTSATYGQASTFDPAAARVDAGNRWLWRRTPVRLEAESVRDAMLAAAGELNTVVGGKGYSDVNSYYFKGTQFYDPIDPANHASHRRTIYRMWARGGRSPFLDTFDCPDPSTTTPRRSTTVTPLQALSLMNHSFTLRMADSLARRLQVEAGDTPRAQVQRAHQLLYSREATPEDLALALPFIERRGLAAYCRAAWNSAEFLFVD